MSAQGSSIARTLGHDQDNRSTLQGFVLRETLAGLIRNFRLDPQGSSIARTLGHDQDNRSTLQGFVLRETLAGLIREFST